MKTYSRQFKNEHGDTVTIRTNEETRYGIDGVNVLVGGAEGDTEFFVTKQEAVELYEALGALLKRGR